MIPENVEEENMLTTMQVSKAGHNTITQTQNQSISKLSNFEQEFENADFQRKMQLLRDKSKQYEKKIEDLDKHRQYIRKEFKMDQLETVKENSNPN